MTDSPAARCSTTSCGVGPPATLTKVRVAETPRTAPTRRRRRQRERCPSDPDAPLFTHVHVLRDCTSTADPFPSATGEEIPADAAANESDSAQVGGENRTGRRSCRPGHGHARDPVEVELRAGDDLHERGGQTVGNDPGRVVLDRHPADTRVQQPADRVGRLQRGGDGRSSWILSGESPAADRQGIGKDRFNAGIPRQRVEDGAMTVPRE